MDLETSSEHDSLADSTYEIISEAGAIDDISSVPSRVPTPSTGSDADDFDSQDIPAALHLRRPTPDDTPLASAVRLPALEDVSIECGFADSKLELGRPFRIRYHGSAEYQNMVVEKIAQAIATSNSAEQGRDSRSRYNVIQLSTFAEEKTSPQVTLIPSSGAELIVETCETCRLRHAALQQTPRTETSDALTASLQECPNDSPQDLAVYMHVLDGNDHVASMVLADYSVGNDIPTLEVADVLLPSGHRDFPDGNLHIRSSERSMPINFLRFLDLNAAELNRHIAFLTEKSSKNALANSHWLTRVPKRAESLLQEICCCLNISDCPSLRVLASASVVVLFTLGMAIALSSFQGLPGHRPPAPSLSTSNVVSSPVPTTSVSSQTGTRHATLPQYDWLAAHIPTWKTIPQSAIVTVDVDQSAVSSGWDDPPVELVHVKDWLYYVRMPNEMAKARALPQIQVTASSNGRPVDLSLAKWNATVYSLELHPGEGGGAIDVFVGFSKSARVYTYKVRAASSWLAMKRMHSWVDQKSIESGIAACVETTKEISRMASKEVALFRNHANGLASSSSEWLHSSMNKLGTASTTKAVSVWRNFELQTVAMTKALQRSSTDVSNTLKSRMSTMSGSLGRELGRQIEGLAETGNSITRELGQTQSLVAERIKALQKRFSDVGFPRPGPIGPLATAQARAKAVAEDIKQRLVQRSRELKKMARGRQHGLRKTKSGSKKGWRGFEAGQRH